ncbi:(RS)-norcoclaurine 6-O-methyltransferase-like [Chenopodium quinoa]|uniref:(RS)-norcoclaurine 6-O-methyltransferase-like n=1 Tax=Chenopodium quinoa TaxID=63459 RepID=UPI000B797A0A|nr:(RS)-norcoclaurine 6-O-methyltransferase-like [Chenopodium quinoa]
MEQIILRDVITNGEHNNEKEDDEEAQASVDIWKYVFGFTEMAIVKCAIDLGIANVLHRNGGSMSLTELASSLKCPAPSLYRVMRFLAHRKIFKLSQTSQSTLVFAETPLSRRLLSQGKNSMAAFIQLESSPVMLAPWLGLSNRVQEKDGSAFDAANGEDVWSYASNNIAHSKLINDAMACDARVVVPQIINECPSLFDGVSTVVDVGGGDGTASSMLVEGFPWTQGINFDLPHVASEGLPCERVQHVGGNMFESIPKADVAFIMWVLHDWGDDECIQILKNCKEAIAKDKGKVIIVESVIEEDAKDKFEDVRLMLDMVMLAHTTNGKERTFKEWSCLLNKAGFGRFDVNPIQAVQSVIVAYP